MNIYLLPLDLCKDLERMMNSFWWENRQNKEGGINWRIGFRRINEFNLTMLGKQGWKLLTNPNSLVAQVLKARYFPHFSFSEAKLGHNPSYAWRSIMVAHHVVLKGSRIQIDEGQNTLIGRDPWLLNMDSDYITNNLHEDIISAPVRRLMQPGRRVWDLDVVADLFNSRDRDLILQIPPSSRRDDDLWYWLADARGKYTVRSCYQLLTLIADDLFSSVWNRLWKLDVPDNRIGQIVLMDATTTELQRMTKS